MNSLNFKKIKSYYFIKSYIKNNNNNKLMMIKVIEND